MLLLLVLLLLLFSYCCWCWKTSHRFYVVKMVQIHFIQKWETFIVSGSSMSIKNVYISRYSALFVSTHLWAMKYHNTHNDIFLLCSAYMSVRRSCVCVSVYLCIRLRWLVTFFLLSILNLHFYESCGAVRLLLLFCCCYCYCSLASWFINPNNIPPLQNALYKVFYSRQNHARFYDGYFFHHQEIMLCLFSFCRLSIYAKKLIAYILYIKKRLKYFYFLNFAFRLKLLNAQK